jgi:mono/diheme cytochrome c family protein/roadblock/LC7 domain-containing protein
MLHAVRIFVEWNQRLRADRCLASLSRGLTSPAQKFLFAPSRLRAIALLLAALLCASNLHAEDKKDDKKNDSTKPAVERASYFRDIRPIFQEHCQGCHQPAKRGGDFLMTEFAKLLQGGESGLAAIVPGYPAKSNLVTQITPDKDNHAEMPAEAKPLNETQRDLIARWISEGATDDTPASAREQFDAAHPPKYPQPPLITALDVSPGGSLVAISGYHEVLLHRTADLGKGPKESLAGRLIGLSERIQSVRFSPDGKLLAVAGGSPGRMGEIQIWNVADKSLQLARTFTYDTLYGVSWSPDGTKLGFGCADNSVRAINAASGEQILFQGAHSDWALATTFSKDGSHLISASRDRSLKLIEVATQRFVDNITSITPGALKGGLAAVERRPDKDEVLVGGSDGTPKLFRIYREAGKDRKIGDDFNLIRNFDTLPGRIYTARFYKDGSQIVVGSSNDGVGELRVYATEDAKLICKSSEPLGPIYAAAFSPDGRTIIAGGYNGTVYVLDAVSGTVQQKTLPVEVEQK